MRTVSIKAHFHGRYMFVFEHSGLQGPAGAALFMGTS